MNYERIAGRYPHHPVAHPQDDKSMDSSVWLSVGHLTHLQIPAGESDYTQSGDMADRYPGRVCVDVSMGLSQGSSRSPAIYMQLTGWDPLLS